ncbi:phospholipase D-like domain-containing protein [Alloiococcus sp. CFN-8]|uniref:phospholipase D-like domain-containing protein n=1 Tax=Alloiococcus sp. CFN-8 TaxID=3416081 RepID=UPI003CF27C18
MKIKRLFKDIIKKEYFNLPNLMGYLRILIIPFFLFAYLNAETNREYLIAFLILAVSYLTDFFDGIIARRFNMVTDLGKVLDPVADKLTHGALALILLLSYPLMLYVLLVFLCKELYMAVMGIYLIKKGKAVHGAQWHGKICIAALDLGMLILLLFPKLPYLRANILIIIMLLIMCFSFIKYFLFHIAVIRGKSTVKRRKPIRFIILVLIFIFYSIIGAAVPYLKVPEVSETYKKDFNIDKFYSNTASSDRATIIEDNGEALAERIRGIEHAKKSIILSTFDIRSDSSGKKVIAALKAAAERGVSVQIMVDAFNSYIQMEGNPCFLALVAEENVEIRVYNTMNLLTPWKWMSRMHDKYLIVDESLYILGGRNTFNYFLGDQDSHKNIDRDVLVYNTGGKDSSIYQLIDYFEGIWDMDYCKSWHKGSLITKMPSVEKASKELKKIYAQMKEENEEWFRKVDYAEETLPVNNITLLSNPTTLYAKEPWVFYGLSRLMENARKEAIIHTPYIICNDMMYQTFKEIVDKDIPLTLMTNSALNNGNPFGAVDYVLNKADILDTGMEVLEYEGGVSYHGKSIVIDDDISIVGSFNMDMKSVYQSTEMMLVIDSEEVNEQLKDKFSTYQQEAKEAILDESEMDRLLADEVPMKKKIQRFFIALMDPWIRFLL